MSDRCVSDVRIKQVDHTPLAYEQVVQQYPNLFKGAVICWSQTVPSVAQPAHRIPFCMRKHISAELDSLERQVDGSTPWISPLVIIPKKTGDFQMCVDMIMANKAINQEQHPSPTVDDLIHTLNGATIFLKLGLRSGYHKLSLAPESMQIHNHIHHPQRPEKVHQIQFLAPIRQVRYFRTPSVSKFVTFKEYWTSAMMSSCSQKPKMLMTKPCKQYSRSF